jgi:phosphatidylinositol glycan class H protein
LTGFLVVAVLLLDYRSSEPPSPNAGTLAWLENAILTSPAGQFASLLADRIGRIYRLLTCAGLTWLIFRKGYTEESLLVIRGLGVQTSTSSPSYLWTSSTRFIPTSNIQDIFIHEAFKGFEVRFYLSIVVEGEEDVVVVFPVCWSECVLRVMLLTETKNILPRREILEDVWRGARACLYEPKT